MKIVLDPGHGKGNNKSPVNPAYAEGTRMWEYSWLLKSELENYGFEVTNTRPELTDNPSLSDRGKAAKGKDLFLSLHSNAPGSKIDPKTGEKTYDPAVTGTVAFVSMKNKDNTLAKRLTAKVSELMGHQDRGIMTNESVSYPGQDYYGVLRSSSGAGCPNCIILEHGFHTNLADSMWLLKDENLTNLAKEEAKIIAEYYGEQPEASVPQPPVEKTVTVTLRQIKSGFKSAEVKTLQTLLNADGYRDKSGKTLSQDGIFGSNTDYALRAFQKANGLSADGICGKDTWHVLLTEHAQPPKTTGTAGTVYRVQIGAYTVKENAENMKKKLEEQGFSAIIREE